MTIGIVLSSSTPATSWQLICSHRQVSITISSVCPTFGHAPYDVLIESFKHRGELAAGSTETLAVLRCASVCRTWVDPAHQALWTSLQWPLLNSLRAATLDNRRVRSIDENLASSLFKRRSTRYTTVDSHGRARGGRARSCSHALNHPPHVVAPRRRKR